MFECVKVGWNITDTHRSVMFSNRVLQESAARDITLRTLRRLPGRIPLQKKRNTRRNLIIQSQNVCSSGSDRIIFINKVFNNTE